MHVHEKYRGQHAPEDASNSREICNTSRRLAFGSSRLRLGCALDSPRLELLVLQTSHTRLESPSSRICYTIYSFEHTGQSTVDRMPVLVAGVGTQQLLDAPKFNGSTETEQDKIQNLRKWSMVPIETK